MKIIAKTTEGKEFFYLISSAHSVPTSSAKRILDIVNAVRYQLSDGEKWHLYDVDEFDSAYNVGTVQRFRIRSGRVFDCRAW